MDIGFPRTALARTLALALVLALTVTGLASASGGISTGDGDRTGSSSGQLRGVPRPYAKFSGLVAGKTKLSLRVLGAWSLAEGGPKDNPLNIGPGQHYGTVGKGAKATNKLLHGELYREILRSRGESDGMQIKAIANSPWCPGCKGYGKLLHSAYNQVHVKK